MAGKTRPGAIVQPFFSTYLANRGQTYDLFTRWLVLPRLWLTNQTILSLGFRRFEKHSIKLQPSNTIAISNSE
jgi:hypothetical protein